MATREQIEGTYNYMDALLRDALGENFDFSCAFYDGDFTKTLEEAQRAKHRFILEALRLSAGSRVLDVGCGWGGFLAAARERGVEGVGIALATRQVEACRRNGLDVHLLDWHDLTPDTFGRFDGIVVMESFEHFCSPEAFAAGEQDRIYEDFFRTCRDLLPEGGRVYVQSMVWGPDAPAFEEISLDAPRDSNAYVTAVLGQFYPGSYGAHGAEQIARCASPFFKEIHRSDGTRDYLETMPHWGRWHDWNPRRVWLASQLAWAWLTSRAFRRKVESLRRSYNQECFRRGILTLCRIVLERH